MATQLPRDAPCWVGTPVQVMLLVAHGTNPQLLLHGTTRARVKSRARSVKIAAGSTADEYAYKTRTPQIASWMAFVSGWSAP